MKTVMAIVCMGLMLAFSSVGAAEKEAKPIQVTAVKIAAEYTADADAADKKYQGKTIEVEGIIESVDTIDIGGPSIAVSLATKEPIMVVQCMMAGDPGKVANKEKLTKGRAVLIRGRCDGGSGNVLLRECVLVRWK